VRSAESGDTDGALRAYREFRERDGDDASLLGLIAVHYLTNEAISAPDAAERNAAVRALIRGGTRGVDGVHRVAAEGAGLARALALEQMSRLGARCARASVAAMASEGDPELRALGVRSLNDRTQLVAALQDIAPVVRIAAIRAQRAQGTPENFVRGWSEVARMDPAPGVRVTALRALGAAAVGLEAAIRGLEDEVESVRLAAAEAAVDIDAQRGWLAVQGLFQSETNRPAIAACRARLRSPGPEADAAEAYLVGALQAQDSTLRLMAVSALRGANGSLAWRPEFERRLREETDVQVRLTLALVLAEPPEEGPGAVEALRELAAAEAGEELVALQAALALERFGLGGGIERILASRESPNSTVRAGAYAGLARAIERPDLAFQGLEDIDARVRIRTAGAILGLASHRD